jgi:Ca2+-binding EF-hand superfamily protein/CDGSH-type Zn-finger protein
MANLTDTQIRTVFDLFDADGSGFVDADELGLILQALGFGDLPKEDVDALTADAVVDGNTHIFFDDFDKLVKARMATRNSPEEVAMAFKLFDADHDGALKLEHVIASSMALRALPPGADAPAADAALKKLFADIFKEANLAFPDDNGALDTLSFTQWKLMLRAAVVDKRHKVDESAYNLKTRAKVAKKGPSGVKVEAGKTYYWCACGLSKTQPFCDGSHGAYNRDHGTDFAPVQYVAEEARTVWFCCCKQTASPPFCDGTHTSL